MQRVERLFDLDIASVAQTEVRILDHFDTLCWTRLNRVKDLIEVGSIRPRKEAILGQAELGH